MSLKISIYFNKSIHIQPLSPLCFIKFNIVYKLVYGNLQVYHAVLQEGVMSPIQKIKTLTICHVYSSGHCSLKGEKFLF